MGKGFDFLPAGFWFQRHNDMKALAAGGFYQCRKAQVFKTRLHFKCGGTHHFAGHSFIGIKVKYDLVRRFDRIDHCSPDMNFHHAELNQCRQAIEVADVKMLLLVLGIAQCADGLMHAGGRMLLEKPLAANPIRRAQKAEGAVDDELLHARPDRCVIIQQVLF